MSRSHRKSPVLKSSSGNLKRWRTEINKSLRRRNRTKLRTNHLTELFAIPNEIGTLWDSPADGYLAAWNYFTERRKRSLFSWELRRLAAMTEDARQEAQQELERRDRMYDERLKRKLRNK